MQATKSQLKAAFDVLVAVAEAVRAARRIPIGTLYAALMSRMSLEAYEGCLRTLKGAGLVTETLAHELVWTGPDTEDKQ